VIFVPVPHIHTGKTWSTTPRNLTDIVRRSPPQPDGSGIKDFYGLVGGIQIKNGRHKGRLVLPGYAITTHRIEQHYAAGAGTMFSDDGGMHWRVGTLMLKNDHQFGGVGYDTQPSESTVAELANGSLLLNIRDSLNVLDGQQPDRCGCRLLARSDDGGETFSQFWNEPLLESGNCEAHMLSGAGADGGEVLWFVNPRARIGSTPEDDGRVNGTVYFSREQGARGSWRVAGRVPGLIFPHTDTFNFGYSMMALLGTATTTTTTSSSSSIPSSSAGMAAATTQSIGVLYQNGYAHARMCVLLQPISAPQPIARPLMSAPPRAGLSGGRRTSAATTTWSAATRAAARRPPIRRP
jgi:hypothetical protein